MYVIQHKENKMFYKLKINKNLKHFVRDVREARKIPSKVTAKSILNSFKNTENYEIVKINKKGVIVCTQNS